MKSKRFFINYLILGILATQLSAGTTGKIRGTVTGERQQPLPGANIVIEGLFLGAAADAAGNYIILNIPPGTYVVTVQMMGYKSLRIEKVQVQTDLTTTLDAQLEMTVLEAGEEVVVVSRRRLIQDDATASAAVISADVIDNSPIESFQAIVQTKAGVSVDAGGDLHFRGGRSDEIAYLVDGIPNVNPYHSGLGVDIATNAIQELSVITGAFSAEYGQAMSGIVNIITKDPQSQYHGSVSMMGGDLLTEYDLDISSAIKKEVKPFNPGNSRELEASLSGPVPLFKHLRFFTSLRHHSTIGYLYGIDRYVTYAVARDTGEWTSFAMNPAAQTNLQGKLTYLVTNNLKLQYNYLGEDNTWQDYNHTRKYTKAGRLRHFKQANSHFVKLTHQLNTRNFYTVGYSRSNNNYEYYAYKDPFDSRYLWSGYYRADANYEFYNGGTVNDRYDRQVSTDLVMGQWTSQIGILHEVKTGFEYKHHDISLHDWTVLPDRRNEPWVDADSNGVYDPGEIFTDYDGSGSYTTAKDDNGSGIAGDIIVPEKGSGNSFYSHKPREVSAYLQDKIEMQDFVINLGLRWDFFDPDADIAMDWTNPDTNATKPATTKQQFSPRFSIAYPITDRGKLFFSYGHFFQMPPYNRLYHNPDFVVLPGVIKSDIGNADLKPQKTVSYEVGFEQEVSLDAAVYVKVFYRDMRNLLGQRVYIMPGGSDSYALFINRDWGNVKGITLSFDQRFTRLVSGSVDYTYQVAVGNESDPTRTRRDFRLSIEPQKKVVDLDWDQPHALRFVLNIGRTAAWRLSAIGRIESGYPYTPKDANAIVRVAEENSGRKPVQANVDLNAYKIIRLAGYNLRLFVKTYNLLDRRNENYVHDSSGRAGYSLGRYGDISTEEWNNRPHWYSEPRRVYLGFSVDF